MKQTRSQPADRHARVWIANVESHRPVDDALLDDVERARADTFLRPADRERFVVGVAVLNRAVAFETGRPAAAIAVERRCETCGDAHGRPRLPGTGIEVSVAHSGAKVLVAVTRAGPVGIDIEHTAIARTTPPAARFLAASEPQRAPSDVYRYWCRKESVAKATGEGLRVPFTEVVVSPAAERARLISYRGRTVAAFMADLDVGDEYVAALTVLTAATVTIDVRQADQLLRLPTV